MHRIRLREPWTATITADATTIVYSRKFHRPSGVEGQPITLRISLLLTDPQQSGEVSAVLINGVDAEARTVPDLITRPAAPVGEHVRCEYFQLKNLEPFNILEIRVTGSVPTIGASLPRFDATQIPTFGSFVIESVELQID